MKSVTQKAGTLLSATLHSIVDGALQANAPVMIEHYIREANDVLEDLQEAITQLRADNTGLERKKVKFLKTIAQLKQDAETLLASGKRKEAVMVVGTKQAKEAEVREADESVTENLAQIEQFRISEAALQERIMQLRSSKANVIRGLEIAKTKNTVVRSMDDLTAILADDGANNIIDWAQRMADEANIRLEDQLERLNETADPDEDPAITAELLQIEQSLKERELRLSAPTSVLNGSTDTGEGDTKKLPITGPVTLNG